MRVEDFNKIVEMWERLILVEALEGYSLEIDEDVRLEFAAIALYLDSTTVRAAGEIQEYYEGYKQAATDILNLIGVELVEDHEMKTIQIKRISTEDDKQEILKKHIWE
jgi:hypothetical protein